MTQRYSVDGGKAIITALRVPGLHRRAAARAQAQRRRRARPAEQHSSQPGAGHRFTARRAPVGEQRAHDSRDVGEEVHREHGAPHTMKLTLWTSKSGVRLVSGDEQQHAGHEHRERGRDQHRRQ